MGLGRAYIHKRKHEEAIAEFQKVVYLSRNMPAQKADLAWAYAMAGRRSEAIKILDELKRPSQQKLVPSRKMAVLYAALGEKDRALEQLEKAYSEHLPLLLWLKVGPDFDGLRSDPRFTDLIRRVGIPQ